MTSTTNDVPQSVAPSIAFEIPIKKVSISCLNSRLVIYLIHSYTLSQSIHSSIQHHRNSVTHLPFKRDWQHKHTVHAKRSV